MSGPEKQCGVCGQAQIVEDSANYSGLMARLLMLLARQSATGEVRLSRTLLRAIPDTSIIEFSVEGDDLVVRERALAKAAN